MLLLITGLSILNVSYAYAQATPLSIGLETRNAQGTWHQDSNGWWFEYSGGGYPTSTWEEINNYWYYFNSDGYMLIGWQLLSGEWYYLEPSSASSIPEGAMVTGWRTINSVKYYFAADGRMIIEQPSSTKTLLVKGYTDDYFDTQYGQNYVGTLLNQIQTPFKYVWNISFTTGYSYQTPAFPNSLCSSSASNYCGDAPNSSCSNSTVSPYHHRNANKNLNFFKENTPEYAADIKVAFTSTPLCGVWSGSHATGILGVTFNLDSYTYITELPSSSQNVHVRIIQHEMGHMFGAHDGVCTSNQSCVMKGSFDNRSLSISDIWCDNCKEDFDRDAQ